MKPTIRVLVLIAAMFGGLAQRPAPPADVSFQIRAHMDPPRWATLERQLLNENVPACREFFKKYFDDRGYLQCFVRWGANDGPDDAFENFNRWPELHALGASDEILEMFSKGHEGLIEQYTEAKTTNVPIARQGMYYKEFIVQSDWMHHGEGLQLFNRMGLSIPTDPKYQARARRFAGFYMGEDPEAPNYDPAHKIIRSMENGSRGPMLRKATASRLGRRSVRREGLRSPLHGESTFEQFLAHYQEYGDVVGDHFLNLVATTLPMNAYLLAGEPKYKKWIVDYMDAWLDRMKQNGGVIPSFVDLDGKIGGPEGTWWKNAYGWGFSPVNPVTGKREDRNRIPRALVGFNNALLVTGDQKYVDAWRTMIDAVNSHARVIDGKKQYPTMCGAEGWYGWRNDPWNVGALEVWYWSQKPRDLERAGRRRLAGIPRKGRIPSYPGGGAAAGARRRCARGSRPFEKTRRRRRSGSPTTCSNIQPRGHGLAGAVDVGCARAGPRRGTAERAAPLLRSSQEAGRCARGRSGARIRAVRYASHGDARQSESIPAPDRHRAGRRLRRASAHIGDRRWRHDGDRRSVAERAARSRFGPEARVRDEALCQHSHDSASVAAAGRSAGPLAPRGSTATPSFFTAPVASVTR